MNAARLYATSLTRSLELLLSAPDGRWGNCVGSPLAHHCDEIDRKLPWLRQESQLMTQIAHPEAAALVAELASLEALRASIHT